MRANGRALAIAARPPGRLRDPIIVLWTRSPIGSASGRCSALTGWSRRRGELLRVRGQLLLEYASDGLSDAEAVDFLDYLLQNLTHGLPTFAYGGDGHVIGFADARVRILYQVS
jgi:hypothetical protein